MTTWTEVMVGQARNVSIERRSIGTPATGRYCFGRPPTRLPLPPATISAAVRDIPPPDKSGLSDRAKAPAWKAGIEGRFSRFGSSQRDILATGGAARLQ